MEEGTHISPFETIRQIAEEACRKSGQVQEDHFTHVSEMVNVGSGVQQKRLEQKQQPPLFE